jgi:serine/threonine protein kinase
MDGYEVCRRLKAEATTTGIPVIFISALDDVTDKVRGFDVGAVDFVTKPFQGPEVLSRVGAHLQLFRLRRELELSQKELGAQNAELHRKNEELVQAQRRTERVFSALAAALPGTVLDDRYRLEAKIGAGGYGTVFRAEHVALKRSVAVKVFRPWEGSDTPLALERFRREGVSASRLSHPNAVTILDCGISSSGIAYLVMELLEGMTLTELLAVGRPLPFERSVPIAAAVCDALAAAHSLGLVHRDVKPDNIFLHQAGRDEVVKVLDFGIAKMLVAGTDEVKDPTLTRGIVGTPAYVAPERLKDEPYDGRADVYSVGVVLYQMLTARPPFVMPRENPFIAAYRTLDQEAMPLGNAAVPDALERLVLRALAKDPAARPTAAELAAGLRAAR